MVHLAKTDLGKMNSMYWVHRNLVKDVTPLYDLSIPEYKARSKFTTGKKFAAHFKQAVYMVVDGAGMERGYNGEETRRAKMK